MSRIYRLDTNNVQLLDWQPLQLENISTNKELKRNFTGDEIIWRYLDFSKFIDLILNQKLHLTRTDYFEDKFEGELPLEEYLESMHNLFNEYGFIDNSLTRDDYHKFIAIRDKIQFFISCWHINEKENYAMWKVYLSSNEGIAIKTTINSLVNSIKNPSGLIYDKVNYMDYNKESINEIIRQYKQNDIRIFGIPCLFKRKFFEYESEFRIIKLLEANFDSNNIKENLNKLIETAPKFEKFTLDFDKLDFSIYISPFAGVWFESIVKELLSKLNIEKEIIVSNINEKLWYQS